MLYTAGGGKEVDNDDGSLFWAVHGNVMFFGWGQKFKYSGAARACDVLTLNRDAIFRTIVVPLALTLLLWLPLYCCSLLLAACCLLLLLAACCHNEPHHNHTRCGAIESYNNLKLFVDLGGKFDAGCLVGSDASLRAEDGQLYPNRW